MFGNVLTLSKHPIITMVIGFFLTGFVGQWLTNEFSEAKVREEIRTASVESIQSISQGLYNVRAHRLQVVRLMVYGSDHETLKNAYDIYQRMHIDWAKNYVGHLLTIRESVGANKRILIEKLIDERIQVRRVNLHSCVTSAYVKLGGQGANRSFSIGKLKCGYWDSESSYQELSTREQQCLLHAINTLHSYVVGRASAIDKERWQTTEKVTKSTFDKFCPFPGKKPSS